jgi:phosphoketolase
MACTSEDEQSLKHFFKQFCSLGKIGSHCRPETPGSLRDGGEQGYSISHAFGAVFDNPGLLVTVAVGDSEAETGLLATAWHSNKFLNPVRDRALLPHPALERLQNKQPHADVSWKPAHEHQPARQQAAYPPREPWQRPRC